MIKIYKLVFALVIAFPLVFVSCNKSTSETSGSNDSLSTSSMVFASADSVLTPFPELTTYISKIKETLKERTPVMELQVKNASPEQSEVQKICLIDSAFLEYVRDLRGQPYRNEIFGIYPARQSDFVKENVEYFKEGRCYRVEMYNFGINLTTIALVSLSTKEVFQVVHYKAMQPELPEHLKDLAIKLAIHNQNVQKMYEGVPSTTEALMADTKTALNNSKCERSKHLCVAPTFVKGTKALWAIVDLTDLRLAGVRWTNLGETPVITQVASERTIQNEAITNCFCKTAINLERDSWKLDYMITSNDGLKISDVSYKGKPVLSSAKLVDWHVNYSKTEGFGYSDAIGCPYFSSATVVAVEPPVIADLMSENKKVGFVIEQYFRSEAWPSPCNYEYFQRYEFYFDGRFRVAAANIGRGCGNDGTYRPVFRIAFSGNSHDLSAWEDGSYKNIEKEGWKLQNPNASYPGGSMFKIKSNGSNYSLIPGNGQFGDGGRGDNAYIYYTVKHAGKDEGESDLPTIGTCCNIDYRQGPEKFIEPAPEQLIGKPVVIWYVPQLKNDDTKGKEYCWAEAKLVNGVYKAQTYPCIAGPMFKPE